MKNAFEPSAYQTAIFTWIVEGRGNAMVNAVAGSGKTTTLIQAASLLKTDNAIFFAFNKHIADELNARLKGVSKMAAKTIHAFGNGILFRALGKTQIDGFKYRNIAKKLMQRNPRFAYMENSLDKAEQGMFRSLTKGLAKLGDMARTTLAKGVNETYALIGKYQIDIEPMFMTDICQMVPALLERGISMAEDAKVIDFTDMLYLPIAMNLPVPGFQWIFVDEAQDLSALQQALVLKASKGRMLFVGDSRQAIMGFAGADEKSFWAIKAATNAVELPLSICYRCPSSHVEMAKAIVPAIEARPGAAVGIIDNISENLFSQNVQEGDLVLCRMTAPLVSWCIKLIKQRIPARVKGRDIASDLCDLARKVAEPVEWDSFLTSLNAWKMNQIMFLEKQEGNEELINNVTDKADALTACYTGFGAANIDDLCNQINALFTEDRASVTLSTIHRAKGLEADTVFVLYPEKLPLVWSNQTEDQATQEWNLKYVAFTRAKNKMVLVEKAKA